MKMGRHEAVNCHCQLNWIYNLLEIISGHVCRDIPKEDNMRKKDSS